MAETDCIGTASPSTSISVDSADTTVEYESAETTPVHAIVEALCRARDESYDELRPLHDYIDTDALNSLLGTDTEARIVFDYEEHTVTVHTDTVTVAPTV